jgi:hypothetical protein
MEVEEEVMVPLLIMEVEEQEEVMVAEEEQALHLLAVGVVEQVEGLTELILIILFI